jgi:hypothetical protein
MRALERPTTHKTDDSNAPNDRELMCESSSPPCFAAIIDVLIGSMGNAFFSSIRINLALAGYGESAELTLPITARRVAETRDAQCM